MATFAPTPDDFYQTRAILRIQLGLPTELVLIILEEARYWTERRSTVQHHMTLLDLEWSLDFSATYPYLGMSAFPHDMDFGDSPKIREIEFTVVSHDQGWTTENTRGTFETSSWFEISILRPGVWFQDEDHFSIRDAFHDNNEIRSNIYSMKDTFLSRFDIELVHRPSEEFEPQRMHCEQMRAVTYRVDEKLRSQRSKEKNEGKHAWYLQGNEVGRATSVFDGEMIPRYNIVWGCPANPVWSGNEGTGRGEGFIDGLQKGDWICIWARAKRRGWENHVHGIRVTIKYML